MLPIPAIPWPRRAVAFLLLTLAAVVGADLLLWGCAPGWTAGAACLLAGALVCWRRPRALATPGGAATGAVLVLAALACVHDVGPLPILVAGAALVLLLRQVRAPGLDAAQAAADLPILLGETLARPWRDRAVAKGWRRRHGRMRSSWRLWLPALAVGALFAGLFALANPVLERWLVRAWDVLVDLCTHLPDPLRILLWLAAAMLAWLLLRARLRRYRARLSTVALPSAEAAGRVPVVVRVLLVANALFLLQTGMDALYLGGEARLPDGLTWAAYAHRGAYPLLAAALATAAVVLICFRPGGAAERHRWARLLVWAWLAQTVILVGSSLWRLHLYIDAYGYTQWRLAAAVWMLLVACGLALIALRIARHRSNRWLLDANSGLALLILLACAWVDWDGAIARGNLARHQAGRGAPIDVAYLAELGPSAVPVLEHLAWGHDPDLARAANAALARQRRDLAARLDDARAWTWVRWRAQHPAPGTVPGAAPPASPAVPPR